MPVELINIPVLMPVRKVLLPVEVVLKVLFEMIIKLYRVLGVKFLITTLYSIFWAVKLVLPFNNSLFSTGPSISSPWTSLYTTRYVSGVYVILGTTHCMIPNS